VRTGDASAEVWLEGTGGRSYCCEAVSAIKRGRHTYRWRTEQWEDDRDGNPEIERAAGGPAPTFYQALRLARRKADAFELAAKKTRR